MTDGWTAVVEAMQTRLTESVEDTLERVDDLTLESRLLLQVLTRSLLASVRRSEPRRALV